MNVCVMLRIVKVIIRDFFEGPLLLCGRIVNRNATRYISSGALTIICYKTPCLAGINLASALWRILIELKPHSLPTSFFESISNGLRGLRRPCVLSNRKSLSPCPFIFSRARRCGTSRILDWNSAGSPTTRTKLVRGTR